MSLGCELCESGWRMATENYVLTQAPDLPDDLLAALDPEQQAVTLDRLRIQRAALATSVYPCKACNSETFYRWLGGHLASDHDTASCDECRARLPRRRGQPRPAATPPAEPVRKDLDL
jgi:hypothetical protein